MTVATDPRKTGISASSSLLEASAVAVILPSSGSSNATGQITHTTALPAQPVGTVKVFLPAGVVTAGSQGTGAGLYEATYSSTTVCQLTGTGIVTANGAYTQSTSEQALATVTVPGGAMGLNGGVLSYATWSGPNNGNSKSPRIRLGGIAGTQHYNSPFTTSASIGAVTKIRNRGAANAQVGSAAANATSGLGGSTAVLTTGAVDTTADQALVHSGQLGVATDYLILEVRETWLLP